MRQRMCLLARHPLCCLCAVVFSLYFCTEPRTSPAERCPLVFLLYFRTGPLFSRAKGGEGIAYALRPPRQRLFSLFQINRQFFQCPREFVRHGIGVVL
jgi:hypothetical protein